MPKLLSALWDMAGSDALAVAQQLFGRQIGYLSPFQSIETSLEGCDCSVLRLCDRNFRIRYSNPLDRLINPLQRCVWVKQYDWLSMHSLPIEQLPTLAKMATARPPHRLANLPNNQAVPANFKGIPILIWRHSVRGEPAVELHAAATDKDKLIEQLEM